MAYVDAGPPGGQVVLLLHGEPTWSSCTGTSSPCSPTPACACVAPDLVGFGRSDKPTEIARPHVRRPRRVDPDRSCSTPSTCVTSRLVGQDWGGLIGLRLAASTPIGSPGSWPPTPGCRPATPDAGRVAPVPPRRGTADFDIAGNRPVRLPHDAVARCARRLRRAVPRRVVQGRRPGHAQLLVPTTPDDPARPPNRGAWDVLALVRDKPFFVAFSDATR